MTHYTHHQTVSQRGARAKKVPTAGRGPPIPPPPKREEGDCSGGHLAVEDLQGPLGPSSHGQSHRIQHRAPLAC